MDTLKLTTLTMLIPIGWAVSVDAYPDPFDDNGAVQLLTPQVMCGVTSRSAVIHEDAPQSPDRFLSDLDAILGQRHLIRRPEPRDLSTDACRLDLEHIDIN